MSEVMRRLAREVYPCLPPAMRTVLDKVPTDMTDKINEIRMRVNQPLSLVLAGKDVWLSSQGAPVLKAADAYICTGEDVERSLQIMSRHSIYAWEKELQQGYLTLAGGHRVGLAGQVIVESGKVKTITNISSLNIRIAREIKGCADTVMRYLFEAANLANTLIISPPRCGKTTILRDIVRQLSNGVPSLGINGMQVGLVDERSEIAACVDGVPSMDIGNRVDVLDGCPKASGMLMLIRSMSPSVIITDEIGRQEDAEALQEAVHAGVAVIASVHGRSVEDILGRPYVGNLVGCGWFDRFVILSSRLGPGTVEEIRTGINPGKASFKSKDVKNVCW